MAPWTRAELEVENGLKPFVKGPVASATMLSSLEEAGVFAATEADAPKEASRQLAANTAAVSKRAAVVLAVTGRGVTGAIVSSLLPSPAAHRSTARDGS
jgi:hypothetical protein